MSVEHSASTLFEVTLELRTRAAISPADLEVLTRKLKTPYPSSERFDSYDFPFVNGVGQAPRLNGVDFYQLHGKDPADIIALRKTGVSYSRHAPYAGHEHLIARAAQLYRAWHRQVDDHRIERIGFRSRNRLDIPVQLAVETAPYDFLHLRPAMPFATEAVEAFVVSEQSRTSERWQQIVIATTTASPLIDHTALLLDIDLGVDIDPPAKWPDIVALSERLRLRRNEIFDASVTDRAKALIT